MKGKTNIITGGNDGIGFLSRFYSSVSLKFVF